MDSSSLAPVYLVGIAINALALAYAAANGQWLFAGAFALVLVYLAFRYRMLRTA